MRWFERWLHRRHTQRELEELEEKIDRIDCTLLDILRAFLDLIQQLTKARKFNIAQGDGMAITGTQAGGSPSTFVFTPVQADGVTPGALQTGNVPTVTSTDPLVAVTPSADGLSANIAVGASDTNTAYPLTVSGIASDGSAISTTFTIPILPATPPPPVPATGFSVNQTA